MRDLWLQLCFPRFPPVRIRNNKAATAVTQGIDYSKYPPLSSLWFPLPAGYAQGTEFRERKFSFEVQRLGISSVSIDLLSSYCFINNNNDVDENGRILLLLRLWSLRSFSRRIAHYWTIGIFSLPAASATGGQALRHSWTPRTLVCGANKKNSTAGLLIVKWIQLLLVFSWGFQPQQRVINLDPAF